MSLMAFGTKENFKKIEKKILKKRNFGKKKIHFFIYLFFHSAAWRRDGKRVRRDGNSSKKNVPSGLS